MANVSMSDIFDAANTSRESKHHAVGSVTAVSGSDLTVTVGGNSVDAENWCGAGVGSTVLLDYESGKYRAIAVKGAGDRVIDCGTTNSWTWEKWASGKLVQRYKGQPSVKISTSSGNMYVSAKQATANPTFPVAFTSIPTVQLTAIPNGHDYIAIATGAQGTTESTFGGYYLMRPQSMTTARAYVVAIECFGWWK